MRADLRPLVRIEKALEQSAENRRVDQAPVEAGGREQQADFDVGRARAAGRPSNRPPLNSRICSRSKSPPFSMSAKRLVEIRLRFLRLALGGLQKLLPHAIRQQLHAVGEEAEDELIDEMRDGLPIGIAMLQRVGNRLELVGGFLGELRARAARAQARRDCERRREVGRN